MFSYVSLRVLLGGIAAFLGALTAEVLDIPLPWLLGPLFFVGALRLANAPVATIRPLRNVGQWIIGVSLGLYFSPEIGKLIAQHWGALVAGMFVALVLGIFGTWLLCKVGKADVKTAWFSSAIGGASEMSVLAERYGARVDLVASAHSLRVLAVVTTIPFGFEFAGIVGQDDKTLSPLPVDYGHLFLIGVLATASGILFSRLRIASAWVLGPLLVAALLTLLELTATSMPVWVTNLGQLFLGWALGDRYRPAFFKAAPRFMSAVAIFFCALNWGRGRRRCRCCRVVDVVIAICLAGDGAWWTGGNGDHSKSFDAGCTHGHGVSSQQDGIRGGDDWAYIREIDQAQIR